MADRNGWKAGSQEEGQMLGGRDFGTHRAYEFRSAEQPEVAPMRPPRAEELQFGGGAGGGKTAAMEKSPSISVHLPNRDPRLGQPVWAIDWSNGERRDSITGPAARQWGKSIVEEALAADLRAAAKAAEKQAEPEPTGVFDGAKDTPESLDPIKPVLRSWDLKHDYEILFKDSPDYFVVKNARMVLAANGWVIFYVFKGNAFAHQEMYPTQHIHRVKALKVQ